MTDKEILIIGAGPGGYVAALRAAQLGAKVTLVEKNEVGGVCLNVGCIPTKALLRSAEVYELMEDAKSFGLSAEDVSVDWGAVQKRKARIVKMLTTGVSGLLKRAGVTLIKGRATFTAAHEVEITTNDSKQKLTCDNIIIATGSRPAMLPLPGFDAPGVIDSTGALALEELPESMLIIGGGVIGVEFATIFSTFGVKVTIVEMLSNLIPTMDTELGSAMEKSFKRRKIKLYLDSRVEKLEEVDGKLSAHVTTPKKELDIAADKILVSVGRKPNVEDLGLEAAGIEYERGGITVDSKLQTSVPGVYAIGDVKPGIWLAHVAEREGEIAAENIMGHDEEVDYKTVPSCVFTHPEASSVGLTEAQAREDGYEVIVGNFPFAANGKALSYGTREGFVKIVANKKYGEVLGVHIFGPHASDLIHEAGLALAVEATLDDIDATIHGHPTLAEVLMEASLDARGKALHK